MLETDKLIAEIAERYHIRVEPDDPIFVAVTLNRRVMEDTIREMLKVMVATLDRFDTSIHQAEDRAGRVLAEQVKESVHHLRQAIYADIGAASVRAEEIIRRIQRAHSQQSLRLWTGIALFCMTLLSAGSFWLGHVVVLR